MANHISCVNKDLTPEQLIKALVTKDANGDFAIRTMYVTACAYDAIDCSNSQIPMFDVLKQCIGIHPTCGKPALRLVNPTI